MEGICEFCGKELEPFNVGFGDSSFTVWRQCNCEGQKEDNLKREWEALEADKRLKAKIINERIEKSRIPKRYREANDVDELLYETAFKDGLYLFGGVGTGKTTIACSIGLRAIERGKKVLFVKAYEVSELIKDELSKIENADLLIIDDIGAENTSEWNNTRLRMVIDKRYDSMLPVVITSNYSKDQLKKLLLRNVRDMTPKAIVSRLTEMTKEIKIDGEDFRK